MAISTKVLCDVCSAETANAEMNHWLLGLEHANRLEFRGFIYSDEPEHYTHLCGHACAHKFLDTWLNTHHERTV